MFEVHCVPHLPIRFPEREIFFRLGGNTAKTILPPEVQSSYRKTALQAYEICRPCGCWTVISAEIQPDGMVLDGNIFIPGSNFAARCAGVSLMWCGAVTVGREVLVQRDSQQQISAGAVYDAVAGECADEAMDILQKQCTAELRRHGCTLMERRYSPGYGDMPLSVQKFFYERLNLSQLDIELTVNNFLIPEKSVTAFAGVIKDPDHDQK